MFIIGLTGQIAAGKSEISTILKTFGAIIIDADIVAREVVEKGTAGAKAIFDFFGENVFNKDETLNRKALGEIVFSDKEKLEKLNEMLHPLIVQKVLNEIEKIKKNEQSEQTNKQEKTIVIDAALLFETNLYKLANQIWVVESNEQIRLQRLMQRDNLTKQQAQKRIASQQTHKHDRAKNTKIIYNNADGQTLFAQVQKNYTERWY